MELDRVLVGRISRPRIVVSERPQAMPGYQIVQRNRRPRRPLQFPLRAILLHIKHCAKFRHAASDLIRWHVAAQGCEFVHFDDLYVSTEGRALQGQIGVHIQHAPVIVPHHAQAIMFHDMSDLCRGQPVRDFVPRRVVILEHSRDLKERNAGAPENIGDFRRRTRLAPGQPFAGHAAAILDRVERGIIDGPTRRQIQNDDRNLGPTHDRQHGGGQRVGSDVEKEEVHIRLPERVPGLDGFFRGVDHPQIHDLDARAAQPPRYSCTVLIEPGQQTIKLSPIRLEADGKQSYPK